MTTAPHIHSAPARKRWVSPVSDDAMFGRPVGDLLAEIKSTIFDPDNVGGVFAGGHVRLALSKIGEDELATYLRQIAAEAYARGAGTFQE